MNKFMLLGGAALLAISGAAWAQSEGAAPAPDAAAAAPAPVAPEAPAVASPAPTDAAPPTTAAATDPAPAPGAPAPAAEAAATVPTTPATPAAPATASADITAKVNAEWAKYDEGNKGKLTALEFGTWVMAVQGQDVTTQVEQTKASKKDNLPAVKVLNATASAFSKADTDKDRMISPTELAAFLSA